LTSTVRIRSSAASATRVGSTLLRGRTLRVTRFFRSGFFTFEGGY
jgi:hypothetical protein